ncbi:glycosyltransferase family 2 protein [Methylobrevis pamukkalensis]|uniref:Glycosyltransferase 2-like domain-containing protein n=1 Tax=Methylobrevis pamukkalensis TaxID=1439726 RepID=A0A1E3H2E3_9HYPH|nr:glycosyltransferase family 2 protein [Methylobrevis pamukkalensis]ODN70482.1 hypothetical protein A6302_02224 [Methylobrevis pamukkalensis]
MTDPVSRPADPLVSLVVPVFNEAEAVPVFLRAVDAALADLRLEIVFINDGSTDATLAVLGTALARDPRCVVVNLSRNFGKESALTAGLASASGDVVVPMDVDLQDPPEVILRFLDKWREGYDVAYGLREDRSSDGMLKRQSAVWFYRVFNRTAETPIPENTGDFRLMDRRVVDALNLLPERVRFMKGLFAWVGFRAAPVPYVRAVRQAGRTKFTPAASGGSRSTASPASRRCRCGSGATSARPSPARRWSMRC